MDWFFYNLVMLMKLCKIQQLHWDKAPLFLRNQVICLKNWKLRRGPTTTQCDIFGWNWAHVSYLTMAGSSGFYLDLELLIRKEKNEFVETRSFYFLQKTQEQNKIENPWTPFFRYWKVGKVCKVSQKILKSIVVGAHQSFQFSHKIPGFLKTIELCLNFCREFCFTLLVLSNYNKISP